MKQSTNHTDALLRQRLLEELPLPQPPQGSWEALEQKLRKDGDLGLQAALNGLTSPAPAAGWQALERKLDLRTPAETYLAEQLAELRPEPVPGSWETLVDRMERENGKAVDAIVGNSIDRPLAGGSTGWAQLAARLELIGWRRGVVTCWKIMEGSLLLSFLLLLVRFGPGSAAPDVPMAGLRNGFPVPLASIEVTPDAPDAAVGTLTEQAEAANLRPTAVVQPVASPEVAIRQVDALVTVVEGLAATTGLSAGPAVKAERITIAPQPVAALPIKPLTKAVYLPSPALTLPEVNNSEPVHYYVNAFISPFDFNRVVTPATSIGDFDISGDRRFTQGSSFGLLIDVEQGKNGLQIGAIYSRRSYIPTALKWYLQDEYTVLEPIKGYSRFIFESITFPLNYKRTLLTTDNWRVSGRIGMSLSVIARSSFNGQEDVVAGFNALEDQFPTPVPATGGRDSRPTDFSSRRKLENPPSGWLEGGSILANSSFYLGGGIIVERLMNPRWSVYVSPTIGRVIYLQDDQGIGPYNDRIHLNSLRMGSRYLFGGK